MKARKLYILLLSLIFIYPAHLPVGASTQRSYSLPLIELERVVWLWLSNSGLHTSRFPLRSGQVWLQASNQEESWQISLNPRSALATEISATCTLNDQRSQHRVDELWIHIDGYVGNTGSGSELASEKSSEAVLSRSEAVVCIIVKLETGQVQLSGFLIDSDGLILATAHDLKAVEDITVSLEDGRKVKGHLLKTDFHRDLALIDIRTKVSSVISLSGGRAELAEGDTLMALGCADNRMLKLRPAIITGPPRLLNSLPLWQVTMEALPGSSGSPVFDAEGNLVALVRGRYRGTDSVGFLTPLATIRDFLEE